MPLQSNRVSPRPQPGRDGPAEPLQSRKIDPARRQLRLDAPSLYPQRISEERIMGFGRGILLWLLGVPIPIIILLALFWR